ncbi:hypothetical protein DdX_13933 [Ditylenchus destructor]|uniref:Uncharacterized protein n=1 Tax=Ditylenchus destructor TaxID=166010 RepID=A0AAD4MVB4_9BILA|nr:hypothetical protein DdX_13933 [Ditylenchus destructor]
MVAKIACTSNLWNLILSMIFVAISMVCVTDAQLFGMGPYWGGWNDYASSSSGNGLGGVFLMCSSVNCGRG